jgi:two-component system, LuxR family, response regulator FixJ
MPKTIPLIYIVDDDVAVARALKRLLCSWGMQVQTFASGGELLAELKKSQNVDCAVIDVQMPGMTGLEVQAHLSNAGWNLPVIFMTAHESEGVEEPAMRAGAIGFLNKPFSDTALVELILEAIKLKKPDF